MAPRHRRCGSQTYKRCIMQASPACKSEEEGGEYRRVCLLCLSLKGVPRHLFQAASFKANLGHHWLGHPGTTVIQKMISLLIGHDLCTHGAVSVEDCTTYISGKLIKHYIIFIFSVLHNMVLISYIVENLLTIQFETKVLGRTSYCLGLQIKSCVDGSLLHSMWTTQTRFQQTWSAGARLERIVSPCEEEEGINKQLYLAAVGVLMNLSTNSIGTTGRTLFSTRDLSY